MQNELQSALRRAAIMVVRRRRNDKRHEERIAALRKAVGTIMSACSISRYTLTVDGVKAEIELVEASERISITATPEVIECLKRNGLGNFVKATKVAPYIKVT